MTHFFSYFCDGAEYIFLPSRQDGRCKFQVAISKQLVYYLNENSKNNKSKYSTTIYSLGFNNSIGLMRIVVA